MLHTVIPVDIVMREDENWKNPPQYFKLKDGLVSVSKDKEGSFIIDRLYSTDPMAYLDKKLYPGRRINNTDIRYIDK